MVSDWTFVQGGRKIAYYTDTVHSGLNPQCMLVDVASGKTLRKWRPGQRSIPAWAKGFETEIDPDNNR